MHVAEFFSNRLIEFAHQCDLCQLTQVPLHELSKLLSERRHCLSMAAHVGKRDPRDDAARAQRELVDIPVRINWPHRYRMHPRSQPWQFQQARGALAYLASTTSGLPFSTMYVASSAALLVPTFFAA